MNEEGLYVEIKADLGEPSTDTFGALTPPFQWNILHTLLGFYYTMEVSAEHRTSCSRQGLTQAGLGEARGGGGPAGCPRPSRADRGASCWLYPT